MTSALEQAMAVRDEGGRLVVDVPDGWQQGRGAFGGIVVGALARAMQTAEPGGDKPLRTITADLCAPVQPGEHELQVEVLRRGKRLTNVDARMIRDGEVVARASGALSGAQPVTLDARQPEPPSLPDWQGATKVPMQGGGMYPVFAQHFEYRPTGPLPFTGGPEAVSLGWISPVQRPERYDHVLLVALLDVWWPAVFSVLRRPILGATTMFAAEVLVDPSELDPAEPLGFRGRTMAVHEGFAVELRELWSHGRLVAANQQTMAHLDPR